MGNETAMVAAARLGPETVKGRPQAPDTEAQLRAASVKLEAAFLSEMLKASGLDGVSGEFGGGIGEDQTASFMRDLQARQIAEAGGIGLAESLFTALVARDDGA